MTASAEPVVGAAPVTAAAEPVVGDINVCFEKYKRSELAEGATAS